MVTEEHVTYSLEVWGRGGDDTSSENIGHDGKLKGDYTPLAKFALNPYPIHHPKGMDVAVIHLKQEDTGECGRYFLLCTLRVVT